MKLSTILDQIDMGSIALPEFQRGYVWSRDQVRKLMRSLYRGYPVGSLLMWETRTRSPEARGDYALAAGTVKRRAKTNDPESQMPDLFPACIGLADSRPGRAVVSEGADAADGCGCVTARIGRQGHRQRGVRRIIKGRRIKSPQPFTIPVLSLRIDSCQHCPVGCDQRPRLVIPCGNGMVDHIKAKDCTLILIGIHTPFRPSADQFDPRFGYGRCAGGRGCWG